MQKEAPKYASPDENVDNELWDESDDSEDDFPLAQRANATPTSGSQSSKMGKVSYFDCSQSEGTIRYFDTKSDKIPFNLKDSQSSIIERDGAPQFSQSNASQLSQRSQTCSQLSPTFSRSESGDNDEYYGSQIGASPMEWEVFPSDHYRCVPKYIKTILRQWRKEEMSFDTKLLLACQKEIDDRTRSAVIDWLVHSCSYLKVPSRALFLACRMFDKMLSLEPQDTDSSFITAIACLSLATKAENSHYPGINKYLQILADENIEIKEDELINLELQILSKLNFNLTVTTQVNFLKLFMNVVQADAKASQCAMFISICSLLSSELALERAELVALASIAISLEVCDIPMDVLDEEIKLFGVKKLESTVEKILVEIKNVLDDRESLILAHFNSMYYCPPSIQYVMPKFVRE